MRSRRTSGVWPTRSSSRSATSIGGPVSPAGRTRSPRAAASSARVVRVEDDGQPGVVQRPGDRRGLGHRTGDPDPAGAVRAQVGDQPDRVVRGSRRRSGAGPGPAGAPPARLPRRPRARPCDRSTAPIPVLAEIPAAGTAPMSARTLVLAVDSVALATEPAARTRGQWPRRAVEIVDEGGEGGVGAGAGGGEVAVDRFHDLQVALELGLGAAGAHDDPGAAGQGEQEGVGRRQVGVVEQVPDGLDGQATELGRRARPAPPPSAGRCRPGRRHPRSAGSGAGWRAGRAPRRGRRGGRGRSGRGSSGRRPARRRPGRRRCRPCPGRRRRRGSRGPPRSRRRSCHSGCSMAGRLIHLKPVRVSAKCTPWAGGHPTEQPRRHDGRHHQPVVPRGVAQDVVGQERTDLVAGQRPPVLAVGHAPPRAGRRRGRWPGRGRPRPRSPARGRGPARPALRGWGRRRSGSPGSGSPCSMTTSGAGNPARPNAASSTSRPTPCIAV